MILNKSPGDGEYCIEVNCSMPRTRKRKNTIIMFPTEPSSFAEVLTQREASARKTLRQISCDELRALVLELFPDKAHPWAAPFSQFIEEHSSEPAVRGETSDGYAFVYYPR